MSTVNQLELFRKAINGFYQYPERKKKSAINVCKFTMVNREYIRTSCKYKLDLESIKSPISSCPNCGRAIGPVIALLENEINK